MHLCSGKRISKYQEGLLLLLGKKLGGLSKHHTAQIVWCSILFDPSANRWFLRITGQAQRLTPGKLGCSETILKNKTKTKHLVQSQFPKEREDTERNQ